MNATASSNEEWLANEVLTQLSELRKKISDLDKQVISLRSELRHAQLKKPANGKPGISQKLVIGDETFRWLGDENSELVLIEFTDYECPYCARHITKTLPKIKESYIDKGVLRYVLKDFPLGFHQQAEASAVAAICAGDEGRYWGMHDKLFENQKQLGTEYYTRAARELELDIDNFQNCMKDEEKLKMVYANKKMGQSIGVQGTPAFFIGREKEGKLVDVRALSGAVPFSSFSRVIEAMLN